MKSYDDNKSILVLSDSQASIDTICSSIGYSYFLSKQGLNSRFMLQQELTDLQKKIFEFSNIELPEQISLSQNFDNIKCICINISSFKELHPNLSLKHIEGIIGNKKPDFLEHFEEDIRLKQIEYNNSLSTLIAEKFKYANIQPSKEIASILLVGIILSLNGLEENQTTNRDFVAVEFLEQFAGIRKDQINTLMNQL